MTWFQAFFVALILFIGLFYIGWIERLAYDALERHIENKFIRVAVMALVQIAFIGTTVLIKVFTQSVAQ